MPATLADATAAAPCSRRSAISLAAPAVLYVVWTLHGRERRNSSAWASAAAIEYTRWTPSRVSPGSASSARRTGTETSPAIGRSNDHSRSRFSRIVPSSELSTGTTPASASPSRTASNTARNEGSATASGAAKNRSTASSANAPGSPG